VFWGVGGWGGGGGGGGDLSEDHDATGVPVFLSSFFFF
jgi:hypothetical protein